MSLLRPKNGGHLHAGGGRRKICFQLKATKNLIKYPISSQHFVIILTKMNYRTNQVQEI